MKRPLSEISDTQQRPAEDAWGGNLCPECGNFTLAYEEGCRKCYSCGFTEC